MIATDLVKASYTIGPRFAVVLNIMERDAVSLVSSKIFGDDGSVVGTLDPESFAALVEKERGKTFFEVMAECDGKRQHLRSAIVEPEQRAGAMTEMFAYLGSNLFAEFFATK